DFDSFNDAKLKVRDLAHSVGIDFEPARHGYPHFYFVDDAAFGRDAAASLMPGRLYASIEIAGERAADFLYWATTSDVYALTDGQAQATRLYAPHGQVEGALTRSGSTYTLNVPTDKASLIATWLRDLSDGFVAPDLTDLHRKLPGPIFVRDAKPADKLPSVSGDGVDHDKPYFVGMSKWAVSTPQPLPHFHWAEPVDAPQTEFAPAPMKKTRLNDAHRGLGAKMVPFAGWEMPVQYTGVLEEHLATRTAAGLFDVSHLGVWDARGETAAVFLDAVFGNEASALKPGESAYTHFIAPNGHVHDDAYVYCLATNHFLIVVNASNDDKDWAWVNGVLSGEVMVDADRQWAKAPGRNGVTLRNLRVPESGPDQRVDIALQGPKSRDVLLALADADAATAKRLKAMTRTNVIRATIGSFDLILSRTGYTGEQMGFELFVHPDKVVDLWNALIQAGAPLGLKPCGLASRDSLRTEAGLPLYGDELAGHLDLSVGDSGFDSYVKTHKPWFIGRAAFLAHERQRKAEVTRFRFAQKSGRMAHNGDPVLDASGRVIGEVTCCSIDAEGFRLGQALLPFSALAEGMEIKVMQGAAEVFAKSRAATQAELEAAVSANGGKVRAPEAAAVLSKFPKRK
ncbi:MAG: hypothetical protein ACT4QE_03940, partial [Anaerolineales bacterium]